MDKLYFERKVGEKRTCKGKYFNLKYSEDLAFFFLPGPPFSSEDSSNFGTFLLITA